MRPETAPWLRQAEADLETAQINLDAGRWYAASWFAQQAAEKGLKAVFLERQGREAPRIHDLLRLGRDLGAIQEIGPDLSVLNPVFSLVRYPGVGAVAPVDEVNENEAGDHIRATEAVLNWVTSQITL